MVFVGEVLGLKDFGMDANDKDFLVVGAVENADAAALGQALGGAPEEIMVEFFGARMLEREDLATLGIDAGHDMLDGAVLARAIHGLKDEEKGVFVVGVEEFLEVAEFVGVFREKIFVVGFGGVEGIDAGFPFGEVDLFAFASAEFLRIDSHDGEIE